MAVVFVFCSSVAFAETTVDLIYQRAESGDATAQTLMGMMTYYGYKFPRDTAVSDEWYQAAADAGDSFAKERVAMSQRRSSTISTTGSVKSSRSTSFNLSKEELETKVTSASTAEFLRSVTFEELILKRDQYIGKVVELQFRGSFINTSSGENPYLYVFGKETGVGNERLFLSGQDALEWAVVVAKKAYGV